MEYGYLQHGNGTQGPFLTEVVPVKMSESWPTYGTWYARFANKWRKVHVNLGRTWIVYQGEKITIKIEGV